MPLRVGSGEDEEFSKESDRERNARERTHRDEHREREPRRAAVQSREMGDVVATGAVCDDDHHEECEQRHQQIAAEIKRDGEARVRRDRDEQIARVRDARIREQALEVCLRQRGKVAVNQRERGEHNHRGDDFVAHERDGEKGVHEADEHDESRRFRADGKIRGHGRGRALIHVGHPDLKGRGGDLEAERDHHEHEAEEQGSFRAVQRRDHGGDFVEVRLAGDAENPGDAVNEKSRRERSEDEVFHAGFERRVVAPHVGDEHIKRNRDEFDRDEDQGEIDRRCDPHQARAGEHGQRKKLAETRLRRHAENVFCDDAAILDRHDEDDDRGDEREAFEKHRERIGGVEIPRRRGARCRINKKRERENQSQAGDARPRDVGFFVVGGECLQQQKEQSDDDDAGFE